MFGENRFVLDQTAFSLGTVGILLLAAIPGTPIALQFTRMAKKRLAFAAVMTFVLSVVSIALTPLAVEVMPQIAQRNERPILNLSASVLLYIAMPLCAGLWVTRRAPNIARRLVLPLEILATVVFLFLMWETRLARREACTRSPDTGPSWQCFCCWLYRC
jgi:predicted Na+-dependent transporter